MRGARGPRLRCARARLRLVGAGDGNFIGLLRGLCHAGLLDDYSTSLPPPPPPPRWALTDFSWAVDVTLRGEHVLSYFLKYTRDGYVEQTFVEPDLKLCASDFPFEADTTDFRADMYVRRSDGAINRIVKDATGSEDHGGDVHHLGECRVLLYFKAAGYLMYPETLHMADEPERSHYIQPVCAFQMLFTACDAVNRQPHDDQPPLRIRNEHWEAQPMMAAELNRPVCVDADSALLTNSYRRRPLMKLYEEYDGVDDAELSEQEVLTFITALDWT